MYVRVSILYTIRVKRTVVVLHMFGGVRFTSGTTVDDTLILVDGAGLTYLLTYAMGKVHGLTPVAFIWADVLTNGITSK